VAHARGFWGNRIGLVSVGHDASHRLSIPSEIRAKQNQSSRVCGSPRGRAPKPTVQLPQKVSNPLRHCFRGLTVPCEFPCYGGLSVSYCLLPALRFSSPPACGWCLSMGAPMPPRAQTLLAPLVPVVLSFHSDPVRQRLCYARSQEWDA
jgi:hypothetical protein